MSTRVIPASPGTSATGEVTPERPAPLADVLANVSKLQAPLLGLLTALAAAGYLNATTGRWVSALLGLIPGVLVALSTMLGAQQVVAAGTPLVTPVADPAITLNGRLVALTPAPASAPPEVLPPAIPATEAATERLIVPTETAEAAPP